MKHAYSLSLAFLLALQVLVAQSIKTTFRLRIPDGTTLPADVRITGSAFGSNGQVMNAVGGGIYEFDLNTSCGKRIFYNYSINNISETVQSGCCLSSTAQRFVVVPDTDTILPTVCFGTCDSCESGFLVTFRVNLGSLAPSAQGVYVAGNFNNWSTTAAPMSFDSASGYFIYSTIFTANTQIEYKYVNGTTFESPTGTCVTGPFNNRFLTIPQNDTTLPAVCFGSCAPCPASPPAPATSNITLQVNMKGKIVSPEGVHVAGIFNQWNYSQHKLTQVQPNIYQITLPLDTGTLVLYKFSNGSTFTTQELISGTCTQFGNRFLNVPSNDTAMPLVCFGMCDTSCTTIRIEHFDPDRLQAGFSGDRLFIHGMPPGGYPVKIALFDLLGKIIFQVQDYTQPEWIRPVHLPSAPYMLRIELDGYDKVFKLLKVR